MHGSIAPVSGRVRLVALAVLLAVGLAGCAVRWVDERTGVEHLWGVGHLTARVSRPTGGVRAVVTGASTVGLAVGATGHDRYVALGYAQQERAEVLAAGDALCVERPRFGAFGLRLGRAWSEEKERRPCF